MPGVVFPVGAAGGISSLMVMVLPDIAETCPKKVLGAIVGGVTTGAGAVLVGGVVVGTAGVGAVFTVATVFVDGAFAVGCEVK